MSPVLAHAVGDGQFPVPLWAIGYGTAALLVLLALWLRTGWPRPRLPWPPDPVLRQERPASRTQLPKNGVLRALAAAVGLAFWALTIVAAFVGDDSTATNITYYAVLYGLVLGGLALSLVHADGWSSINPFATVARLVLGRSTPERTARPMPAWTAPAMVAVIGWLVVAFRPPLSPRTFGLWLVGHTVATIAGTALWGRAWLREGEGFAVLFAAVGRVAPVHHDGDGRLRVRWPLTGAGREPEVGPAATASVLVLIAVALFDAVREFEWWALEVVGQRSSPGRALVGTAGFAFTAVVVGLVWTTATRTAERSLPERRPWGGPLAVVAAAFVVSRYTSLFIGDGWNLVGLLSDPLGRRWDLLGTASWLPPLDVAAAAWVSWVEVLALVLGGVAAVVLTHDASLAATGGNRRRAAAVAMPMLAAVVALITTGIGFLLGG